MQIKTFAPDKYKEFPIYYRNFGKHFEYFTLINNELYTAHFSITPRLFTKLLYFIGIEKSPYTPAQVKMILKQLRKMAETTIDFILNKK